MPTMSPDEFADSIIQDETVRLRGTTAAASRVNPDQQAEYNRVAKTLNMQPIAVEGWEADAKAQAQAVQIDDATQNTPVLRQKFTDDAFARLAHDDSKPLVTLEDVLTKGKNLGKSAYAALPSFSAGLVGGVEAAVDIGEYLFPSAMLPDVVTNERKAMQKGIKDYRKYLETSAAQVRPVGAPGFEAGVYSGVESFTRNVVTLPLLLAPGGQAAYLSAMVAPVAGGAYTQAKDQGLNLLQSLTFAGLQSGTEFITEKLPAFDLAKILKAGSLTIKHIMDSIIHEQVGEQVATAVQDFNEWAILPENKDKPFWDYLKARPNAALETAVATAIGSGGQIAVTTTANAVMQRMQGRQQDAHDANATAQALDRVAEFAQASKLRDRSPETFKDYVREVSQDGPVQDVYVSGEVLNQVLEAQGVTRQDLEAASPSIAEQLATAVATGGDVRIPVEDFATHLSAPELYQGLADHLKTEPEGMTRTEANEYLQANVETMKAEFDKALASKQGDEAFKASASKVETDILASLEAAGRFTPDVNQQYATLASKVLAVQAARIGITPEEMHARYPVSFAARGGMVGSAMFDQAGNVQTDSPAFKAFYGASVLKDEGGTPQVLYHGTKDTVTAFDLDHPNRKDAGWLGTGVYMTNDPKLANMYAKMKKGGYEDGKVMELYARLENPYMATMEDKQRLRGLGREGADAFTEELKAQGHDGAILTYPDGTQEVVVFDPAAVKSKQNSGTWSRETANIYEQRGKEQVEGTVVPETIDAVANVEDAFAFASSQKFKTNRDFKLAIQNRVLEAADAAGVDLSDFTQAVEQYLVRIATVDARTALQTNPNAVGWYNDRVTKALRIISLLHPEVATDPKAKFAFTWGLAVTSNGLKVDKNFELAEQVYRRFTETGQMPTDIQAGQAQIAINEGLALYNDLVAKYGIDNVIDFMTTRHTVKEVMEYGGKNISGENLTTEVYGAAVLGPKIGNGFFANLYGHFEQLTVDRWFMRTWGRWTGTLVAENKANVKLKQTQLKAMIKAMSAADKRAFEAIIKIKLDVTKLDEVALAINKASTKPENRKLMGLIGKADDAALAKFDTIFGAATKGTQRASYGDELRKVGNALAKYLDGQKEMPSGPPERARIRKVMNQALEALRQEHPDLTMSDLQALLWYPEKRLYDSAKTSEEATTGYEDDEAPDYANSAAALVAEKGVSREDIDAAIKEVDDELRTQAAERARGAGRGAGDGSLRQDATGAAAPAGAAAVGDRLTQEGGVYNQTATTPVFFSALARAVENSQTKSATAEQWKATLLKTPGVKQEEMQWTGLFDLFSDPKEKIDRELILAFLNSNGVQLGEVLQETPQLNTGSPYYQIDAVVRALDGANNEEDMAMQLENSIDAYRAVRDREELQGDNEDESGLMEGWAYWIVDDLLLGTTRTNTPTQFSYYKLPGADDSYKELLLTLPAVQGPSTHWNEQNVVAHARITERTTPEGERVLFLEEVQSDWHQKGRDQGYTNENTSEKVEEARSEYNAALAAGREASSRYVSLVRQALLNTVEATEKNLKEDFLQKNGRLPEEGEDYFGKDVVDHGRQRAEFLDPELGGARVPAAEKVVTEFNIRDEEIKLAGKEAYRGSLLANEAYQKLQNLSGGIPDAPFRKTWAALTMKRILRYAVDNGFSKVAWINGNQQNGGTTGGDGSFFYERNLVNVTNDLVKKYGTKVEQTVRMEDINTEMREPQALSAARGRYTRALNALTARKISFNNPMNGVQELRKRVADLRALPPAEELAPEYAAQDKQRYLDRAQVLEDSIPLAQEWIDARAAFDEAQKDTTREYVMPANYGFDITPELAAFASGGMPLFQGQEARGTYNPGTHQIALNKNADLSTALHELGHFHLEVLADLASKPDAPADIVADMNTVLTWFGEDMTLDSWQAMSLDQKRPYHETFARGFEAYLFEGRAPTEELRGVFQRFRSWLLAVYRDISKLNVELSDEVRSVFDRLVASNEEIVAAQEARAYAPMFDTKPPFMSDEDWIAYQRADPTAIQDAIDTLQTRSLRDMRWLASAKARVLRELQAASRDARKAVKAEVTAEVMAEKVNVARTFLRTGLDQDGEKVEGPHKLDRAAVTALYSDMPAELVDLSALGKGRYGMMADNGLHPDIAAEALGYGSGTELVEDLLNAESSTDKINGMTDQRMLERYGDLTDADAMSRAADEAVHNDARLRFVATELSALEKATGGRKLMASAARGFAKEMVSRLLLRNLRPAQYTAAETRAARAADKALKDGDLVAAATQKRNQLINAHSARAVYKAKAEVEKGMNLFKRIVSAKDEALSRNRNMDLVNASRAILAVYGIGRAKNTPAAYMEKIARYDPVLYADLKLFVDAATQDVPKSGDIRDISLEQFIGLRDTINQMWTMAKRVKEIEIDGKREALADVTATLKDELLVKGVGKFAGRGTQRAVTEGEKKLIGFLGAVALLRRVEEWSKMQGASFERYIYGLVQTSAEKYRAAKIDILPRYRSMIAEIETDLKPFKIYSPELGYTFGEGNGGIGLAELLGAMRHTGNESNLTKLLVGRGWGQFQADGTLDTSAWDAFINRMMDEGMLKARHFDFLQAEWDLHEEIKPLAQKAHHEVYGRYFNEVTANPISNRFGSYRGGYVAASPDTLLVSEAAQRADAEAMFGGGSALFPAPASGFTKGRIENYTVPLALDLRLAPQQIDKVLRFAYLASPIRDVLRILKDRGFAPVLASHDPVAITDLLMPWLERSASQSVSAPARGQGGKTVDAFARAVRSRTSAALLFANLSNTVQNVTGLAPAALRAGKGNIVRSMWAYLRDPMGSAEAVDSASLMMRNRADTQLDDMRQVLEEIVLNPNAYEKVQTFFSRHAQFMQIGLQNVLDRVVWMAAYDKAVADNEQDPVRFADSVVRTTMGSFTPEDATRFESGPTWARPLTLFAGYFIGQANLLGTEFAKANAAKKWGRGLEVYALGVAIPAIAAQVIAMAFRGDSGDGDDDGLDMGDIFKIFFGSQFGYMAAMVPVVGPVVNSALNRFNDKPYDDKISLSPVASMVEAAAGVPKDLHDLFTDKANWSRTIKDVATAATLATGIPFTLAAKPISYVAGVAEGRIEPTGPADVARGLVTGVASPQSKQP